MYVLRTCFCEIWRYVAKPQPHGDGAWAFASNRPPTTNSHHQLSDSGRSGDPPTTPTDRLPLPTTSGLTLGEAAILLFLAKDIICKRQRGLTHLPALGTHTHAHTHPKPSPAHPAPLRDRVPTPPPSHPLLVCVLSARLPTCLPICLSTC